MGKEASRKLECRINVSDGTSERLEPESGPILRAWSWLKGLTMGGFILKISKFLKNAWDLAVAEPKKVIHGIKVGLAISLVTLFYYMRPLYDGVGGNAMWAVMTVVVVFESTVGATLGKCINRAIGTFLAGSLGVGVHWIANHSGKILQPLVLGTSVFFLASAVTFSRFMPTIKARFDYGAMIFILTFSLVSVSGYRVDKLVELAWQRLFTIAIGASICIIISMLFCPLWAGDELHHLICQNLEKLAHSLDECVAEYFRDNKTSTASDEACSKRMQVCKCVLNSKAIEELKANFARWEPAHGRFNFRHPWKQYLKIGASIRNCAYCIETLNGCVNSETQVSTGSKLIYYTGNVTFLTREINALIGRAPHLKRDLKNICMRLSTTSSNVLKELAITMKTMKQSSKINFSVGEMNFDVQELKNALISLPIRDITNSSSTLEASAGDGNTERITRIKGSYFMEILPLATLASLLIENAAKIEEIVNGVNELAALAEFRLITDRNKSKSNQSNKKLTSDNQDHETVKTLPKV